MVLLSIHRYRRPRSSSCWTSTRPTVRRWISRYNDKGLAGGRPAPVRAARLGGGRLTRRIAALLAARTRGPDLLPHVRAGWTPRGTRPQIPLVQIDRGGHVRRGRVESSGVGPSALSRLGRCGDIGLLRMQVGELARSNAADHRRTSSVAVNSVTLQFAGTREHGSGSR